LRVSLLETDSEWWRRKTTVDNDGDSDSDSNSDDSSSGSDSDVGVDELGHLGGDEDKEGETDQPGAGDPPEEPGAAHETGTLVACYPLFEKPFLLVIYQVLDK
jgi:hypothetical protein